MKITIETKRIIFKNRMNYFNILYIDGDLNFISWCYWVIETCFGLVGIKIYKLLKKG